MLDLYDVINKMFRGDFWITSTTGVLVIAGVGYHLGGGPRHLTREPVLDIIR